MWIEKLNVKNCRLLEEVSLELSPHLNLIIGDNASGKTSLLEALSLLSSGKSFRTSHISDVITHFKDSVLVSAQIIKNKSQSKIGIEKKLKSTRIRINQQDIYSQAKLSLHLPITSIHPGSIDLITGSPSLRRSYIDWVAFYLYPSFHDDWKEYRHILKQRNFCLKKKKHLYGLSTWTEKLIDLQPQINKYRMDALEVIRPILLSITTELLNTDQVRLELKSGFPADQKIDKESLQKFYLKKEMYDIKMHRTIYGVHSADIKIWLGLNSAKESASRGQLKLLAIALLLAQSKAIAKQKERGILLIDDLAAELDGINKGKLLNYLSSLNQQMIITSTNKIRIKNIKNKMFHVKHGSIKEEI